MGDTTSIGHGTAAQQHTVYLCLICDSGAVQKCLDLLKMWSWIF